MVIFQLLIVVMLVIGLPCKSIDSSLPRIPITQCCPDNKFYKLRSDSCDFPDYKINVTQSVPPLLVYDLQSNKTIDNYQSIVTVNLLQCAEGFESVTTKEFQLYTDGSILINHEIQQNYHSDHHCLNKVKGQDYIRYCAPDPCYRNKCIRKCCPSGMLRNLTSNRCQKRTESFKVVFNDQLGQVISLDDRFYSIRDNHLPRCRLGRFSLTPDTNPDDRFYILPDGQLFVPTYPEDKRIYHDYCIDDFTTGNDSIARRAFICIPPQLEESIDTEVVLNVYPYLLLVSSVFLMGTFIVYVIVRELRNVHGAHSLSGMTVMCHVASLASTYIGLAVIQLNPFLSYIPCITLAVVVHFSFLSSFTWLNVMSLDTWLTFTNLSPHNWKLGGKRFKLYSIYAWGVPFIIVLIGQILDNLHNLPSQIIKPDFGYLKCWFSGKTAEFVYLYGPISVLILINIFLFLITAVLYYRATTHTAIATNSSHAKRRFRVIAYLFVLMGVSWTMDIVSFFVGGSAYNWMATDILNILTGFLIFVMFVCNPKVWKLLKAKFPCLKRISNLLITKNSADKGVLKDLPTNLQMSVSTMRCETEHQ